MVLVQSCLCCSLLTGSVLAGILSTFLYSVAFFIQLWWIVEAKVPLSLPAYTLATAYLLMAVMSAALLLALKTHRPRLLLSWVFLMILYIFPEAGLVLFMSLYQWGNRTYGVVELSLWLVRVLSNLTGLVCVHSLWNVWREEKSLFRSLHQLGIAGNGVAEHGLGIPGSVKMGGSFRLGRSGGPGGGEMGRIYQTYQQGIGGSQNYLGLPATQSSLQRSPSLIDDTASLGTLSVTKFPNNSSRFMKRSASCASQFVSASRLPNSSLPPSLTSLSRSCSTRTLSDSLQRYAHPQGVSNNEFIPEVYKASLSQPDLSIDPGGVYIQRGFAGAVPHLNIYRGNSRREQLQGASSSLERGHRSASVASLSSRYSSLTRDGWRDRTHPDTVYEVLDSRLEVQPSDTLHWGVGGEVRARGGIVSRSRDGSLNELNRRGREGSLGELSRDSRDRYGDIAL